MEISDDSEAITDSEEEYSRSIGKIVTVNKMKGEKKNGTFYSTGHYLFHLARRWYTLVSVFLIFVLDIQWIINAESQIISLSVQAVKLTSPTLIDVFDEKRQSQTS